MSKQSERWHIAVDELMIIFRDAIGALIPFAERMRMPWREPDAYDDWDGICLSLYKSFVIMAVQNSKGVQGSQRIMGYNARRTSIKGMSFVGVSIGTRKGVFLRLHTTNNPLDSCLIAEMDAHGKVFSHKSILIKDIKFSYFDCIGEESHEYKEIEFLEVII